MVTLTREEWLRELTVRLRPSFHTHGVELPHEIGASCGWPSQNARSKRSRRIGECWRASCSDAKRPEIFISPTLADSIEVGHVLLHELIHAALPDAGHRAPFKRVALKLGLTGRMTATTATPELRVRLAQLVSDIGAGYPHAELRPGEERKQSTRMLKLTCPDCGYTIRTTQKWIEVGLPVCCCGAEFQAA